VHPCGIEVYPESIYLSEEREHANYIASFQEEIH